MRIDFGGEDTCGVIGARTGSNNYERTIADWRPHSILKKNKISLGSVAKMTFSDEYITQLIDFREHQTRCTGHRVIELRQYGVRRVFIYNNIAGDRPFIKRKELIKTNLSKAAIGIEQEAQEDSNRYIFFIWQ